MKRWEHYNEITEKPECMEEQAINMLVSRVVEEVENLPPMTVVATVLNQINWYDVYTAMKEHLNEEEERN